MIIHRHTRKCWEDERLLELARAGSLNPSTSVKPKRKRHHPPAWKRNKKNVCDQSKKYRLKLKSLGICLGCKFSLDRAGAYCTRCCEVKRSVK